MDALKHNNESKQSAILKTRAKRDNNELNELRRRYEYYLDGNCEANNSLLKKILKKVAICPCFFFDFGV